MLKRSCSLNLATRLWGRSRVDRKLLRCSSRTQTVKFSANTSPNIIKSPYGDLKIPACNLTEFVWENIDRWAEKTALECIVTGEKYSYKNVRKMCLRFASSLIKLGFKSQDIITVILPNSIQSPIVMLGAIEAGLIVSVINPLYTEGEMFDLLKGTEPSCIVTNKYVLPTVMAATSKCTKPAHIICIDDKHDTGLPNGIRPFSSTIPDHIDTSNVASVTHRIKSDDTAILPFSSGTTGLPKGVCLTNRNLTANTIHNSHPSIDHQLPTTKDHQDTIPGYLPFFHLTGLSNMITSLKNGRKIITVPQFNAKDFLKLLEENTELVLHCVPRVVLFLANHAQVKTKHLENIRSIIIGGAPCGASDIERLLRRIKIPIVKGYGMTESSPLLTLPTLKNTDLKTIGSPVSNTLAKVVDASNKKLGAGEVGEMCFKGPQVMKGYYKNPKATRETIDEDGWLHTGDIGYFNKEGTFYIVGRKKDLIKVKGFQVAPAELEALLRNHPLVNEAGVIGVPCPVKGEKPVAFVEPKSSPNKLKPSDIKDYVASHVIAYKWIDEVIIVNSVPRNPSGKIQHRQLAEEYKVLLSKNSHNLSTNS